MKPKRLGLPAIAIVAACQPAGSMQIDVIAPSNITFALTGDSAAACFENLRIAKVNATLDDKAVWEIEKTYVAPSDDGTSGVVITQPAPDCVSVIHFPKVPQGYELVSGSPLISLPAGKYSVTGSAQQYWLGGDFSVKSR